MHQAQQSHFRLTGESSLDTLGSVIKLFLALRLKRNVAES
jgi:hypothetical protein